MPATTQPASHGASEWSRTDGLVRSDRELLKGSCPDEFLRVQSIIQSSFHKLGSGPAIYPSSNGFFYAAIDAYNCHHHLIIRPEDVWFSILTQLNLFINKNAEDVRSMFVPHQGRKELKVVGPRDFGKLAELMTYLIEKNIVDPSLREWMMPNFTTTTEIDRVVASV